VKTILHGGTLITPYETLPGHDLVIEDGLIASVYPAERGQGDAGEAKHIDATGLWVIPGLIDMHVHGSAGSDTMDATPAAMQTMADYFVQHGVTSYLPTTITAPPSAIDAAIHNLISLVQPRAGAQHLGVHLEGPYIGSQFRGAQPEEWLRSPDPQEYERWFETGAIRLVALAPELPGAIEMIERGTRLGIRFSVGHSSASYEQVLQAADHGLSQSTHTFNGMTGLHHREPGAAGAVLADERIYAEIIADGIHLHPAVVKLVVRAKGIGRTILVTDAIRAAGLHDGDYDLGGQTVQVRGGIARTSRGSLAGSTLAMDAALRNVMRFAGVSIHDALRMATATPAEALGLSSRKGVIQPGADADLALVDPDLNVQATIVNGTLVYDARTHGLNQN
jgi:N-acetylglucosamine-6-phosphate deacetylase